MKVRCLDVKNNSFPSTVIFNIIFWIMASCFLQLVKLMLSIYASLFKLRIFIVLPSLPPFWLDFELLSICLLFCFVIFWMLCYVMLCYVMLCYVMCEKKIKNVDNKKKKFKKKLRRVEQVNIEQDIRAFTLKYYRCFVMDSLHFQRPEAGEWTDKLKDFIEVNMTKDKSESPPKRDILQ